MARPCSHLTLWMGTGADEPRGDAAASGDPRRLSQGAIGRILVQCGITPPRDTLTTFCIAVNPGGGAMSLWPRARPAHETRLFAAHTAAADRAAKRLRRRHRSLRGALSQHPGSGETRATIRAELGEPQGCQQAAFLTEDKVQGCDRFTVLGKIHKRADGNG